MRNPFDDYYAHPERGTFSTRRIVFVPEDDTELVAWGEAGNAPTPWPTDGAGQATDAALQAVLAPYGLSASLADYAAACRLRLEEAGVMIEVGGASVRVHTARAYRDGLRDTMLAIMAHLRKDGDVLKVFADGAPRAATNAEAEAIIAAAFEHVQGAFNREVSVLAKIKGGAVTTPAEVDAAFAEVA